MSTAAELIALETAMRDLAQLYESATVFAPLHFRAENDLLPRMNAVGALLREHLRNQMLVGFQIESAARELHSLTAEWREELDAIRTGATYGAATAAFERDDQATLRRLVPDLFAGLSEVTPPPVLYYAMSVAAPRRHRPATRPFMTTEEAAENIAAYRAGITPAATSTAWWEQALPALTVGDEPTAVDSPITLALDLRSSSQPRDPALFAADGELTFRLYTPRLVAPFRVVLSGDAEDEWWAATADSYPTFRDTLATLLRSHDISVQILD